jgi:hypothetical protein
MTLEIILALGLVVSAVILFATERLPVDLTADGILGASPQDAIGGFSNPATVTVALKYRPPGGTCIFSRAKARSSGRQPANRVRLTEFTRMKRDV